MKIKLTWPSMSLSQNSRMHWRKRNALKKEFQLLWLLEFTTHKSGLRGRTKFTFAFAPPHNRRMDVDNVISATKFLRDTLSSIVGIDDSKLQFTYPTTFLPPEKGGAVYLMVTE